MLEFFQLHLRTAHYDKVNWKKVILINWSFVVCLGALYSVFEILEPFKREFSLNDKSIQFTYAIHERVPTWASVMVSGIIPLVCLALISAVSVRSLWDLHSAWLGCTLSFMITGIITNMIKLLTGRPRPDFIARCQPRPGSVDDPIFGLSNASICTQADKEVFFDGFKSFPSGHASVAFGGLGFLAFYLLGKLHVFHAKGWSVKIPIVLCPLIGAASVAISRTMDNRHHWHDVLAGSILGLCVALMTYRQLFHPFASPRCHEAFPPRDTSMQLQINDLALDDDSSLNSVQEGAERIRLQNSNYYRADRYATV